jgi:hypothetical protein
MLHFETIDLPTLELLIKIQNLSAFTDLRLVGNTSLALQIGHRKSIDLDLFGKITADEFEVSSQFMEIGQFTVLKNLKILISFSLKKLKWILSIIITSSWKNQLLIITLY